MSTFNAHGHQIRTMELQGWPVRVASYRLDKRWSCRVDNVSPGATIARGDGPTREAAEEVALEHAAARLRRTRRVTYDR